MMLISSSPYSIRYIAFPILTALFIYLLFRFNINKEIIDSFETIMYLVVIIGFIFHLIIGIRKYWPMIDKVVDSGSTLTFMRKGSEIEIDYSQIKHFKVIEEYKSDPETDYFIQVKLVSDAGWGTVLEFMPATKGNAYRKPIDRIYEIEKIIESSKN